MPDSSYRKWISPRIPQESEGQPNSAAARRLSCHSGEKTDRQLKKTMNTEWEPIPSQKRDSARKSPRYSKAGKIQFLTEKDAQVPGEFSKKWKQEQRTKGLPQAHDEPEEGKALRCSPTPISKRSDNGANGSASGGIGRGASTLPGMSYADHTDWFKSVFSNQLEQNWQLGTTVGTLFK